MLHVLTNQIRQAPHAWPGWDTSLATPNARGPLALEPGLLAAARFHADDMAANNCFQHESCDGTDTFVRIGRYFSGGGAGENIYLGSPSPAQAMTGWMNSAGHRVNILRPEWEWLGTGFSAGGRGAYYVQDFGLGGLGEMPNIPGGAYETTGAELRVVANYFDPDGRAPTAFEARLDGVAIPLERISGPDGNATFDAKTAAVDACAELTFVATTASGQSVVFPSTGALLVGAACTTEFSADPTTKPDDGRIYVDANDPPTGCRCTDAPRERAALLFAVLGLGLLVRRRR
jgi:hypothetical protein